MSLPLMIPTGTKLVVVGNKTFLQKKSRRRRTFKLPAKTRQKMATAAKRMKIPVLTLAVAAPAIFGAFQTLREAGSRSALANVAVFNNRVLQPYTGIRLSDAGGQLSANWELKRMFGAGMAIGLTALKRSGVLRGINQGLAKSRLPVRLS